MVGKWEELDKHLEYQRRIDIDEKGWVLFYTTNGRYSKSENPKRRRHTELRINNRDWR